MGTAAFADITVSSSTRFIVNEARVTRRGGATIVAVSATQPTGTRSVSLTVECQTDDQAAAIASRLLTLFATPLRRITALKVAAMASVSTMLAAVLTDVLGSRVRTTFTPPGGGAAFVQDALIDQITHTINVETWTTEYALNSAEAV